MHDGIIHADRSDQDVGYPADVPFDAEKPVQPGAVDMQQVARAIKPAGSEYEVDEV
jgi:hypothetical protein